MHKRKWLRWTLIVAIAVFGASTSLSRALQTSRARAYLIAHLEASFGRPVEVGRFNFSLLDGIGLEAHSVTVSEDPQFGHEYFLRADTLTAKLRWPALFAGRFEFGTLSLARPSLNFVRDAHGRWNVDRWLPPAPPSGAVPSAASNSAASASSSRRISTARLYRIDIDGGRINFKQGDDKSPFALLDVAGRLEQDSLGRWTLDLEARPMRAGVQLQQIGTVALRGTIGGTSTRLQPADLRLTWRGVSLADVLRLASQSDYGARGDLSLDIIARVAPPAPETPSIAETKEAADASGARWSISATARLTGVHGWQLPERPTDPAVNLSLDAAWRVGEATANITKLLVEMQGSRLQGSCELDWRRGFHPRLHIESSSLGLGDLVGWYRAFRPGVSENLDVAGTIGVDATLSGWPPQLTQGALASVGGRVTAGALPPLRIGAINASASRGGLDFAPTEISSPTADASPSTFVIRGSIFPGSNGALRWPANWTFSVDGGTSRIEDWMALSNELGQRPTNEWAATGGLTLNLRGGHQIGSAAPTWLGTADFRGLAATPPLMNQPLHFSRVHMEFSTSVRTITLSSAAAFGANWQGSVTRDNAKGQWTFDLSADHLDASELDRWLGPRARPSLLARIAGLGKPVEYSERDASIAMMAAHGRLRIMEFTFAPLRLERFDADTQIAGRTITISRTQADFFGGQVTGSFQAQLIADPSYRFQGHLARVDLARLGRALPWLANRISGTAWSAITLSAHGVDRDNLVRSLQGDGTIDARSADFRGLNLGSLASGTTADSPPARLVSAKGSFHIGDGTIETSDFILDNSLARFQAEGRADFSHALNFRIHPAIPQTTTSRQTTTSSQTTTSTAPASPLSLLLSGTVEAPKLVVAAPTGTATVRPRSPVR